MTNYYLFFLFFLKKFQDAEDRKIEENQFAADEIKRQKFIPKVCDVIFGELIRQNFFFK